LHVGLVAAWTVSAVGLLLLLVGERKDHLLVVVNYLLSYSLSLARSLSTSGLEGR
jgi:hypothetical protein